MLNKLGNYLENYLFLTQLKKMRVNIIFRNSKYQKKWKEKDENLT